MPFLKPVDERIGEGLIRTGVMTDEQVKTVLQMQEDGNESLFGVIALESGFIEEDDLLEYLETRGL